jgi:hypothetical protein
LRIVCFIRPKANSGDKVRKLRAAGIAATMLLLIIGERRSRGMSKKSGQRPES